MELKNIDYFLAIAGELSLSKAAEKLYVSQSALSKYLTRLEASIGTALLSDTTILSVSLPPVRRTATGRWP